MSTATKFTAGPWKLEAGRSFVTPGGRFHLSYESDKHGNPEWKAGFCELDNNARLIAAAPEMYEALRYALTCLEEIKKYEPNYHFYHYGAVSVDEQCRAALAKAKGRS